MNRKDKLLLIILSAAAFLAALAVFILLDGKPEVRHIPRPLPLPALGDREAAKGSVEKAAFPLETATTAIAPPEPPQLEDARPLMTRRSMPVEESVATLPALSPSPEPFNGCAYNRGYRDGFKAGIAAGASREEKGVEESREGSRFFQAFFPDLREGTARNIMLCAFLGTWLALMLYLLGKLIFCLPMLNGRRMTCLPSVPPSPERAPSRPVQRQTARKPAPSRTMRRAGGLCLAFFLAACGFGCTASKSGPTDATVPMPPLKETPGTMQQPTQPGGTPPATSEAANPASTNQTVPTGTTLVIEEPLPKASGPRPDDPAELAELLDLQASASRKETAVTRLRPSAIRDAARMTTFQTAIAWRYGKLLEAVDRHAAIMETAFNFTPLMMTQGDALIMPPVLTRAGASMRIDDDGTATTASTTYEMLQKARYVPVAPHWRSYLMTENFPEPEQPNPAVLPQNSEERAIWRAAVREAWVQGVEEADNLFTDNVSRLVRDYRGVLLYHLLTAQHLLSRVRTADADLGVRVTGDGNRMNLGQKVYRITEPSFFVTPRAEQVKDRRNKHGR